MFTKIKTYIKESWKILLVTVLLSFSLGNSVFAVEQAVSAPVMEEYTKGGLVNCGHSIKDPCRVQDIFALIARVTNWLIAMAGVYAVFTIITAAFWLTISMGNEEAITNKKKAISNAIVGFILALMAFMLVNTVTNLLLHSKCNLDLRDPLSYLTITDYDKCP